MTPTLSPGQPDEEALGYIAREKSSYITQTARSVTLANIFAPLLCIPLFHSDADPTKFRWWLAYMFVATAIRTWTTGRLEFEAAKIKSPETNLHWVSLGVGLIGLGWGLGWWLLVPDLSMENRMIYLYITTGGMFNSMFGYCVHWPTFYSFTIPIMGPAILSAFLPVHAFPWPFSIGIATLFVYVVRISRNFSRTYEDSIRLRLRNDKLYQELVSERDASVTANMAKSSFIASASHDLRQPMHAVNIYLDSLHMEKIHPDEQKTILKIRNSITTLNEMFDALLNISKLDSYTYRPIKRPFALADLLQGLEAFAGPLASRKGLQLRFSGDQGHVEGDIKLVHQILMNLISNAIHYTDHGHVDIQLLSENGLLMLVVKDTGCGISAQDQAHIFTEFYRVDETRALHDGLGLGLSIVKRLCQLIDARIEVISERKQGATFVIRTPYRLLGHNASATPGSSLPPPATLPKHHLLLKGKVIAVIEDDPVVCEAYRQTLASKGALAVVLPDEPTLLNKALENMDHLDLIISDYRLQTTTGETVIQTLRESFNQEVPAIIVTADTSPAHIHRFQQLNIPVLHKPASFQQIVEAAEKALATAATISAEFNPDASDLPAQDKQALSATPDARAH